MSNPLKSIGKAVKGLVKGVGKVFKKIAKNIVPIAMVAAAIWTGGTALGWWGAQGMTAANAAGLSAAAAEGTAAMGTATTMTAANAGTLSAMAAEGTAAMAPAGMTAANAAGLSAAAAEGTAAANVSWATAVDPKLAISDTIAGAVDVNAPASQNLVKAVDAVEASESVSGPFSQFTSDMKSMVTNAQTNPLAKVGESAAEEGILGRVGAWSKENPLLASTLASNGLRMLGGFLMPDEKPDTTAKARFGIGPEGYIFNPNGEAVKYGDSVYASDRFKALAGEVNRQVPEPAVMPSAPTVAPPAIADATTPSVNSGLIDPTLGAGGEDDYTFGLLDDRIITG